MHDSPCLRSPVHINHGGGRRGARRWGGGRRTQKHNKAERGVTFLYPLVSISPLPPLTFPPPQASLHKANRHVSGVKVTGSPLAAHLEFKRHLFPSGESVCSGRGGGLIGMLRYSLTSWEGPNPGRQGQTKRSPGSAQFNEVDHFCSSR